MSVLGKGEVWRVELGNDHYQVLVTSSDMFNLESAWDQSPPKPSPKPTPACS